MASQKRVFEKGNANSRQSASSQKLIWRKKLEIPDNSPPLIIRNDAGSCDFWNITGGMDQDIFHNIDTDRYSEKLKTMYVVTFRHIVKVAYSQMILWGLSYLQKIEKKSLYSRNHCIRDLLCMKKNG